MCNTGDIYCFLATQAWKVGAPLSVALFTFIGRDLFWRPRLTLSVSKENGSLTKRNDGAKERWFHISIKNSWPHVMAKNVAVFLVDLERESGSGNFVQVPFPRVRFNWPYETFYRKKDGVIDERRNIGRGDQCDLCRYSPDGLAVALSILPASIADEFKNPGKIRLHLKAVGDNYESPKPLVVEIYWDKQWAEDGTDLKKHFSVQVI